MKSALIFTALLLPTAVFAALPDIQEDAWYGSTVGSFADAGYFASDKAFRPSDNATRAEFIELIVKLQGGATASPTGQSFDDVSLNATYYPYFEQAAASGWMKGAGSCLGSHPCNAQPQSPINRAEAAAILQRAFGIELKTSVPSFTDNPDDQWFTESIRIAAGNCILQGDAGARRVRPADNMNRAEMVVMLDRLKRGLTYPDCAATGQSYSLPKAPTPSSAKAQSSASTSKTTWSRCEASDWKCTCGGDGTTYCTLSNYECLNPDIAKPKSQPCEPDPSLIQWYTDPNADLRSSMKKNLDHWDEVHNAMVAQAKELAHQQQGSGCIRQIEIIEDEFVLRYNEYVAFYNSDTASLNQSKSAIQTIEKRMSELEKEFDATPSVCY